MYGGRQVPAIEEWVALRGAFARGGRTLSLTKIYSLWPLVDGSGTLCTMLPYGDSKITRVALVIFFLILIGYGYFEARGLLFGPRIDIGSPVTVSHEQFVHIQGTTEHIASLSMNGRAISVTQNGAFDEPYLLAPGSNRIVLSAKDKYGNTASKALDIYYVAGPKPTSTNISPATSTATTSTTTKR